MLSLQLSTMPGHPLTHREILAGLEADFDIIERTSWLLNDLRRCLEAKTLPNYWSKLVLDNMFLGVALPQPFH